MRKNILCFLLFFVSAQIGYASSFADKSFTEGPNRTPVSAQTIAAGNTITADSCGSMKIVTSGGNVATSTTNTFTAPSGSNSGCVMFLCNSGANTITLDSNSKFVSAGGADVALGPSDCLIVASEGTLWYQMSAVLAAGGGLD